MRRLLCLVFATLLSIFLFAACGRSGILDYEASDASVDGANGCGPTTCPGGCCDESGGCRAGTDLVRCGAFGRACTNCVAQGFETCNADTKSCGKPVATCNAQTCPNGCCAFQAGKEVCLSGDNDKACGAGGRACDACSDRGLLCDARSKTCGGTACDSRTCPNGCCSGNTCFSGRDARLCGVSGVQCDDCAAKGQACTPAGPGLGGKCSGTPTCSPANCASGCCSGTRCLPGADDSACGAGGLACANCPLGSQCNNLTRKCEPRPACGPGNCAGCCLGDICVNPGTANTSCGVGGLACANCAGSGKVCQAGACVDACGTCTGCCQGNVCQAGFLNNRCGSGGVACLDCTGAGETCDTNQIPRVCTTGGTCPSAYGACPAGVTTMPRVPAMMCSAQALQDARVACSTGPNSASCSNYFQFINLTDPACGSCLSDFRFDFAQGDGRGVFKCVAPLVGDACNRSTGCASDCEGMSCAGCASSIAQQICRNNVRAGQCQTFVTQTTCVTPTLLGAGAFCNPATYGGNFGSWLEGVGGAYCNP